MYKKLGICLLISYYLLNGGHAHTTIQHNQHFIISI